MIRLLLVGLIVSLVGCSATTVEQPTPVAMSGVREVKAEVSVDADGLTIEQFNVKERLKRDSHIGSIKYLYVISAWSGDVLIYSTVKGKVTSSGKRLSPTTVATGEHAGSGNAGAERLGYGIPVQIGRYQQTTGEVLQDDGTYGSSVEYLYWFDTKGVYHMHYPTGGQIIHISDQPLVVKKPIINMELEHSNEK